MLITRMEAGLLGDVKYLSDKVREARIDHGPGYRLYSTVKGDELTILLLGGTRKTPTADSIAVKEMAAGL
jgi:putative addiction module killer protein